MQSRMIADLANLLATTPKTIATYAKLGVVKRRGRGKYDEVASVRGFAKHMRARPKGASATSSVASERAGLLSVQRQRAELELAKAKGDLESRAGRPMKCAPTTKSSGTNSCGSRRRS